jgi:hypothetical protein
MSAQFPWIRDSGTISGAPTGRLAITSTSGLYLYNTSNSILTDTNKDLTIETAGTGDIILKTNTSNRLTIDDAGLATFASNVTMTNGRLTVNKTSGGGTNDSVLTLNQAVNGTVMYEERYNSKTAVTGSGVYKMSFKGKNNGGGVVEYGNMTVFSSDTSNGNGRIDFGVSSSLTNILTLTNSLISLNRNITANNYQIFNVSNITTIYNTPYGKLYTEGITSTPINIYSAQDTNTEVLYVNNIQSSSSIVPYTFFSLPNNDIILCSANFNGYTFLGSQAGFIYYFNDPYNIYQLSQTFNGGINTMVAGPSYLYFGGSFTSDSNFNSYGYIGQIDTSLTASPVYNSNYSSYGVNQPVNTIIENNGYLYIGGQFQYDSSFSVPLNYIAIYDYNNGNLYAVDNNPFSNYGFDGQVNQIYFHSLSNYFIIIGGFSQFNYSSGAYGSLAGVVAIAFSTYNPTSVNTVFSSNISGNIICVGSYYDSSIGYDVVLFGGYISSPTSYLCSFQWDGSNFTIASSLPYSISPSDAVNLIFVSPGTNTLYVTSYNYQIFVNGSQYSSPNSLPYSCLLYSPHTLGSSGSTDQFCEGGASSSTIPFYYLQSASPSAHIDITSSYPVIFGSNTYNTSIVLASYGNSVRLIWIPPYYFVTTYFGASFN